MSIERLNQMSPQSGRMIKENGTIINWGDAFYVDEEGKVRLRIADTGGGAWGSITGTLSDQTDLQDALNLKYDASNPAGYISSFTETDPVFTASQAHNIDATDITNLGNLSGVNTGDQASSDFDHGGLTGLLDDDHTQYGLLAGRSGGQTLKGGTGAGDRLVLQGTSANGTSANDAVSINVGNNGAKQALFSNNAGQIGINLTGTTFQATNPFLEVRGVIESRNKIILGRDISASGLSGTQAMLSIWWVGERVALAFNYSTGKVEYIGSGGTQGLLLRTLNRNTVVGMESDNAAYGLTLATTDPNSNGQNLFSVNARFNGTGTYDAQNIRLLDTASNANSTYLNLYSSATYGGTQTSVWQVRKDGTQITSGDVYINNTTKGVIQKSPDGTCWRISVDNSGVISATSITCP